MTKVMKKFVLAALVMFFACGLTLAAVTVTLVSADKDKSEVTVYEGEDKEKTKTYTWSDKTKFTRKVKGEVKELKLEDAVTFLTNDKAKGKAKLEITVEGSKLTEVNFVGGGKKKIDKTDKN